MLCERCKQRPAVNEVVVMEQDVPVKKRLCRQCTVELMTGYVPVVKRCPTCQMTRQDLLRVRKAGCATCYTVFRDELIKITRQYQQGHDHHIGSIPDQLRTPHERIEERLDKLAGELNHAVEQEDYERAARIQKEIKQLEGQGDV